MTNTRQASKSAREEWDVLTTRRVAFLHGDAALSSRSLAKLLGTSFGVAERAVKYNPTKYGRPSFGGWNRAAFAVFAGQFEETTRPILPAGTRPNRLTSVVRAILHTRLPQLLQSKNFTLEKLDAMIDRIQIEIASADVRLGRQRLELLYGDLRASKVEVAESLDVPLPVVERVLGRTKISQGESYYHLYVHEHMNLASAALGAPWDYRAKYGDSDERVYSGEQVAFRRFVLKQAREGKVDWAAVDLFLAMQEAKRAGRT